MTMKKSSDLKSLNNAKSNCCPIATPTIMSPVLRKTAGQRRRSFIKNCAINTEKIGPNSHGIGSANAEKISAPINAMINTRTIAHPLHSFHHLNLQLIQLPQL